MTLDKKVYYLRKREGFSQSELAEKVDVSRQSVSRWEVGEAVPSTDNLKCLSNIYNVPVDILLNDEADLPNEDNKSTSQITEDKETAKKRWSKQVTAAVLFLLVAVVILICIAATRSKQNMGTTPIGEMKVEEDDQSATVGDFSIGW